MRGECLAAMNFWSLFGAVWNVQSYLGYTIINIEAHYWPNTELNSPDHISLKRPDLNLFFFSFFSIYIMRARKWRPITNRQTRDAKWKSLPIKRATIILKILWLVFLKVQNRYRDKNSAKTWSFYNKILIEELKNAELRVFGKSWTRVSVTYSAYIVLLLLYWSN